MWARLARSGRASPPCTVPGEVEREGRQPRLTARSALGGYAWDACALRRVGVGGSESRGNSRRSAPSPRPNSSLFVPSWCFASCVWLLRLRYTTSNGGPLGSCIDEERSELRDVVRVAELASHQFFERKWRRGVSLAARLSERPRPGGRRPRAVVGAVGSSRRCARRPECERRGRGRPVRSRFGVHVAEVVACGGRSAPLPAEWREAVPSTDLSSGEITRRI